VQTVVIAASRPFPLMDVGLLVGVALLVVLLTWRAVAVRRQQRH
jgi:hypothetical protein